MANVAVVAEWEIVVAATLADPVTGPLTVVSIDNCLHNLGVLDVVWQKQGTLLAVTSVKGTFNLGSFWCLVAQIGINLEVLKLTILLHFNALQLQSSWSILLFGLEQVERLSAQILLGPCLLAPIAFFSTLEIVVLALWALPSTIWKFELAFWLLWHQVLFVIDLYRQSFMIWQSRCFLLSLSKWRRVSGSISYNCCLFSGDRFTTLLWRLCNFFSILTLRILGHLTVFFKQIFCQLGNFSWHSDLFSDMEWIRKCIEVVVVVDRVVQVLVMRKVCPDVTWDNVDWLVIAAAILIVIYDLQSRALVKLLHLTLVESGVLQQTKTVWIVAVKSLDFGL